VWESEWFDIKGANEVDLPRENIWRIVRRDIIHSVISTRQVESR